MVDFYLYRRKNPSPKFLLKNKLYEVYSADCRKFPLLITSDAEEANRLHQTIICKWALKPIMLWFYESQMDEIEEYLIRENDQDWFPNMEKEIRRFYCQETIDIESFTRFLIYISKEITKNIGPNLYKKLSFEVPSINITVTEVLGYINHRLCDAIFWTHKKPITATCHHLIIFN